MSLYFYWKSIVIIPFILFMDIFLYNYYNRCAKSLDVLQTYTRVPILTGFRESLSGVTSIRAFGFKEVFQKIYHERLYNFFRVLTYQEGALGWFSINNDLIAFCFIFFILVFIWFYQGIISGSSLGLLLSYILKFADQSYNFFYQYNYNERMSLSMESCEAYTHIVQEADGKLENDDFLKKNNFPQKGKIEFVDYSVKYRPDTKVVLKNLNFVIKPGEKIGIVGRTGSGKSTLCLCLFRIIEADKGKILIDDVNISNIGLSLLRDIITVIPQDPTLLEGTLRENLDPSGKHDDESMIQYMKIIGMDYIIKHNGLDFKIKENGDNLSSGEKQLICLARAMLRKSKIITMDEATSSIDYDTENLIQNAILTTLKDSTVITIAHRLKTILDYDRIFVFENGQLIEQGTPKELIENKNGHFYSLYTQSKF
jgi:ABC-type multidrug transport system fused ATPase/permease subunit